MNYKETAAIVDALYGEGTAAKALIDGKCVWKEISEGDSEDAIALRERGLPPEKCNGWDYECENMFPIKAEVVINASK